MYVCIYIYINILMLLSMKNRYCGKIETRIQEKHSFSLRLFLRGISVAKKPCLALVNTTHV